MRFRRRAGRPKNTTTEKGGIDRSTLGVAVVYVTQMEGRPTIDEIHETITEKIGIRTTKKQVLDTAEAARKRGLLSINFDTDEKGKMLSRYSMRDVKFSKPPEMAQIKAVWVKLLQSKEAKEIQEMLEGLHEEGERKGRLPDIRDYDSLIAFWRIVTPVLGGMPTSEKLQTHRRVNGSIWLPLNLWLKGALRLELRQMNVSESKVQYLKVEDIFLPEKKVKMNKEYTVIGMAGPTKHEAILPDQIISTKISFPTTGFMSRDDFVKCLDGIRIGAKHKEFGLLKLEKVEKAK